MRLQTGELPLRTVSLRRSLLLCALLWRGHSGRAQAGSPLPQTTPDPQLSPRAAYEQAIHPLEVTRHNIANWSDVELAAMTVSIAEARTACGARDPEQYANADLIDLARLCSLGQQWPAVITAAARYLAAQNIGKPLLAEAYIAKVEAELHLNQEATALSDAQAMLHAVPFSPDISACVDEAIDYMRFVHTADALTLAAARQPLLFQALQSSPAASSTVPASPSASTLTLHDLYAGGLALASLQQLAAQPEAARDTVAALDEALPPTMPSDDALLVAQLRKQYGLLGKPASGISVLRSLSMPFNKPPALPAPGAITAMLLFPDWCAACVRLVPQLPQTVFSVEGHSAYVYALLAETVPARKPDPKLTNTGFSPSYAAALLAGTPTVTVAPETPRHFAAVDFPFLILTDANGNVRVLQALGPADFQPGGSLDAAIALVGRTFPRRLPPPGGGLRPLPAPR